MSHRGLSILTCLLAAAACCVAGCGSSHRRRTSSRLDQPARADIYSSLPLQGPASAQGQAILLGMHLALARTGEKVGRWTIDFDSLDDANAAAGAWDAD